LEKACRFIPNLRQGYDINDEGFNIHTFQKAKRSRAMFQYPRAGST
jgi:hypothetical protein